MAQFICSYCEKPFEEPLESGEQELCPHCRSCDFSEARKCDGCGEYFSDDDIHFHEKTESFLCNECYRLETHTLSPREEYELSKFLQGWDSLHSYA